MSTRSYTSLRWLSAHVLMLLLFCASFSKGAGAQATTPLVTASYATALTPPTGLGKVYQTALDTSGDLLVLDYGNSALYEYPANGSAVVTLVAAGGIGGGYANPGIAIDSNNNLYVEANYNNCLLRFPYSTATHTWTGLSTVTPTNSTTTICPNSGNGTSPYIFAQGDTPNTSPYYFQPWAIAVDSNNNLIITAQNSNNFIFALPVTSTPGGSTGGQANNLLLTKSTARAQSVAADKFGNVYFVEESDKSPLPGVLMIPAGSTNISSDAGLTRVDPNLPAVTGVTTDAAGNLYISDSTEGVFFVPNPSGTPQTSAAVLITPTPAYGQASIDAARNILYVPGYNASGAQVITAVTFNAAEFGTATTTASTATSTPVLFGFSGAVTPGSFVIQEAGSTNPDFVLATGGTCAAGTAQAAQSSCTVNVTFTPHAAGSVSAKLLMLDGSGNVLASILLHGTGSGSAIQVLPGAEAAVGSGLKTPTEVAVDPGHNVYVADPGLGSVQMFPAATTATPGAVGTGITAPTGVAVDGGGDLFIADNGSIFEIPEGPTGLVAAGQVTLKTGLGTNLRLAADGMGHLYISDPDNHRVIKLGSVGGSFSLYAQTETDLTGFNAPSSIAVDQNANLFVIDGSNLYKITPSRTQSTVLTSVSGATGLAIDASGAVYLTMSGQTVRIPNESGTLNAADQTMVATDVTSPASIAQDGSGNLYIANTTPGNVDVVSASASYNFGTLTSTTGSASQTFTVLNYGNLPLNVTAFAGTADFSETNTSCIGGPIAVNATCSATITFSPGPGDQGTLTGSVLITGDEANTPVGVKGTGAGAALAASTTTVTATNPTVDGAPAVVTVAATSGKGATPTGQVTLTITGTGLTAALTIQGTLSNGTVTLTPPQLPAGSYTYTVNYGGDRTYGTSTASTKVTVAPGPVTLIQPTMAQVQKNALAYPYVLATGPGAQEPYDGSINSYEYTYPVQVVATDGVPLIGQPVYDSTGKKLVAVNYGSVTFQGAGANCPAVPVAADGTAPFSTTCFTIDTSNTSIPDILTAYTVTPAYSPAGAGASAGQTNPNYTAATGTAISFIALRDPVVQISSNPGSLSVARGSTATATLTLTSVLGYGVAGNGGQLNNYALPVQLACDGLPAYATCTFTYPHPDPSDPQSVAVTPTAPGSVILTVNTNIASGNVASLRHAPRDSSFAALCGLGLLGLAFGRKKALRGRLLTMLCLLLCGGITAGLSGCSTAQLGASTNTTTPSGTYTVMVTAKQVGSQALTGTSPGTVYGNGNQVSLPFTMKVTVQ